MDVFTVQNGNPGNVATLPASATASSTLAVAMLGSTLTFKVGSTTVGTVTDGFNQGASKHGLWASAVSAAISADDFAYNP